MYQLSDPENGTMTTLDKDEMARLKRLLAQHAARMYELQQETSIEGYQRKQQEELNKDEDLLAKLMFVQGL